MIAKEFFIIEGFIKIIQSTGNAEHIPDVLIWWPAHVVGLDRLGLDFDFDDKVLHLVAKFGVEGH